jgi:RNA polymerase sigma-70 factor, ECF subfamily
VTLEEPAFVLALQQLAPLPRAVLLLRDVAGFRTDEVAEMLGTSELWVEYVLAYARARLWGV